MLRLILVQYTKSSVSHIRGAPAAEAIGVHLNQIVWRLAVDEPVGNVLACTARLNDAIPANEQKLGNTLVSRDNSVLLGRETRDVHLQTVNCAPEHPSL